MNSDKPLYIAYAGPLLLETPLLNKGSAFTEKERRSFNLMGLLPPRYENIDEQVERAYLQYCSFEEPINKHIYLRAVQDNNETLFYRLLNDHLEEMLPIIYTPTVGEACEHFSDIYRSARGIFVSYEDRGYMDDILHSVSKDRVKVLVVTDGERVLGLGDQGVGGMGIPIGKLSLYTACGGISPAYTLPVVLDVGTNNQSLLDDPMYMGMRHPRIGREEYDEFVDQFIAAAQQRWPGVLIQFEDFAQPNAMPILQRHKDSACCFNDDIQGTAAVTLGTVLSACKRKGERLRDQNIVFVGAGSAGCGIAEQLIRAMVEEGLTDAEARSQLYMVDRFGLVSQGMAGLLDFQEALAQPAQLGWQCNGLDYPSLLDVVSNVDVGVLVGVSGKPGLFTENVIRQLHRRCAQPIVLPLSNPSRHVEARPEQILQWTDGQAIVATGSPFAPVEYKGERYEISQCNNSYIFPGIGLGVVASKARRVSDGMLMAASRCLAEASSAHHASRNVVLPPLTALAELSKAIAFAVAKVAQAEGLASERSDDELRGDIERNFWTPQYREYRRIAARAR
ncbi:malate dehydrogenase [gamma proteobacterium BDW918]|jgi:malate dehydrogenase (oxaloacetate-decarboxylating)|uniref:NAD-dependent malic enzyme n=1 Tax=Zhongshania aliphaticivorans TaxID=1470434 RepID=UPI00025C18A4|nr:malate dehydrogenase [gamma proteobacterium BDW918]|tara:strand:- start:692 stop:2383 length:1692 start_codon:yes stop_codon:yes gene_type:complete